MQNPTIADYDERLAEAHILRLWGDDHLERGALQLAVASGVQGIAALLDLVAQPGFGVVGDTPGPSSVGDLLNQLRDGVSRDSGLPIALTNALVGRMIIDLVGLAAFRSAFSALPRAMILAIAEAWAGVACRAYREGWYPDISAAHTSAASRLLATAPAWEGGDDVIEPFFAVAGRFLTADFAPGLQTPAAHHGAMRLPSRRQPAVVNRPQASSNAVISPEASKGAAAPAPMAEPVLPAPLARLEPASDLIGPRFDHPARLLSGALPTVAAGRQAALSAGPVRPALREGHRLV